MEKHERLQAVVRYLAKKTGQNQSDIGQQIGYSNKSAFSAVLNGRAQIPVKLPERIAALDPSINIDFLLGTSDRMLLGDVEQPLFISTEPDHEPSRPEPQKPPVPMGVYVPGELIQMLTKMSETINSQQDMIRRLVSRLETEDASK